MHIIKKISLLPVLTCIISIGVLTAYQLPDDTTLREIVSKFSKYNERLQQHKIYLHINKSYYATGETIWFKAYQVNGSTHEPYGMSKVMYAELINEEQKVIFKEKLKVEQGFAYGDFLLPDSLPSGMYVIRAYNNWMRNFDPAFFFHQQVQIFNTTQPVKISDKTTSSNVQQIDLQFFPEGGNLVNGLQSKVAFKAINTNGEGTDVTGIIADETGDTITSFKSLHLGMGAFNLQPQPGKQYVATIRRADSTLIRYQLPKALNNGLVMAVDNTSDESIHVQIAASAATQPGEMYLVTQVRGQIYFSSQINLQAGSKINIPKKEIPSGIVHITLLDSKGNPQCERLAFVNHEDDLQIRVHTNKNIYTPREKITMQIEVNDRHGNPVSTDLSMAVTDASITAANGQYENNILSYLLLTSDLKGNIEQPGFYFAKNNPEAKQALDHLMLTQGWRRFVWKEIVGNTFREIQYETEDGITLSGKLILASGKTPQPNHFVGLSAPGGRPAFQHQYTDEEGNFYFSSLQYTNGQQLLLNIPSVIKQPAEIILLDTVVPVEKMDFSNRLDIQTFSYYLEKMSMQKKIEQSYAVAQEEEIPAVTDTLQQSQAISRKKAYPITDVPADHSIDLDKYNEFPDMTEVLREIVPGILLKNKKGVNSLRVLNIKSKYYFKEEPVYFIDGVPVYEASHILKLDPGMVETIEVYGRPEKLARFNLLGRNGVISVFTRTGDFYQIDTQNTFIVPFAGYHQAREFYTTVYDTPASPSRKPDLRPVLYWNPKIKTDVNGRATMSFYAADNITSYSAMVEGISDKGTPGVGIKQFQVKLPLQSKR